MSLSSSTARNNYTGTGALSVYAYSFRVFDDDDLTIKVRNTSGTETTLTKTTDYTVSGVGVGTGGNVTLVSSGQAWLTAGKLTSGYEIAIIREVDVVQNTDIRNQGSFYPETHEDAFDYLTMIDQQQQDEIDRSLKISDTVDPADFDSTLPADIQSHPGEFLIVNAAGDAMEFGGVPANVPLYYTQSATPTAPSASRLAFWYDTSIQQMKIWCMSEWRIIA
jgi:hypothetical protein